MVQEASQYLGPTSYVINTSTRSVLEVWEDLGDKLDRQLGRGLEIFELMVSKKLCMQSTAAEKAYIDVGCNIH